MEIKLDKQFADNCDKILAERKAKRMSGIESVTILGDRESVILEKCLEAATDLLAHHWDKIADIRDGDEAATVEIAVKFKVDCSGKTPKIITRIGYAQKFTDEREDTLPDNAQPGLGLSDKPA